MIVKSSEADRIAKNLPRGLVAALVFGPDSGLIRERAEILLKTVVDDLGDAVGLGDEDLGVTSRLLGVVRRGQERPGSGNRLRDNGDDHRLRLLERR